MDFLRMEEVPIRFFPAISRINRENIDAQAPCSVMTGVRPGRGRW